MELHWERPAQQACFQDNQGLFSSYSVFTHNCITMTMPIVFNTLVMHYLQDPKGLRIVSEHKCLSLGSLIIYRIFF